MALCIKWVQFLISFSKVCTDKTTQLCSYPTNYRLNCMTQLIRLVVYSLITHPLTFCRKDWRQLVWLSHKGRFKWVFLEIFSSWLHFQVTTNRGQQRRWDPRYSPLCSQHVCVHVKLEANIWTYFGNSLMTEPKWAFL